LKNLVIDIGNSQIKFAKVVNSKLGKSKSEEYTKINFEKKVKSLLSKKVGLIAVSCANNSHVKYIEKKFLGQKNIRVIKRNSKLPIKIDYTKTLGTDRICGALGAVKKYPKKKNILVIDFGTATTYNLVSNKVFKGGLITPGIQTALKSLIQNTSLPMPQLKFKKKLYYKNTLDNIGNGVVLQSLFFTERIINEYKKEFKNLFVIATGGNADLVFHSTKLINKKELGLNLEGLNYFLEFSE
jgi:type III pantothenate kinase